MITAECFADRESLCPAFRLARWHCCNRDKDKEAGNDLLHQLKEYQEDSKFYHMDFTCSDSVRDTCDRHLSDLVRLMCGLTVKAYVIRLLLMSRKKLL